MLFVLERMFELSGATVVSTDLDDAERMTAFLREHDPDVIVYDIPPPYEQQWDTVRRLREGAGGRNRRFVLTTTDKRALEQQLGRTDALEVTRDISQLAALGQTVRAILGGGANSRRQLPGHQQAG